MSALNLTSLQERVDGASDFGICPLVDIKQITDKPLTVSITKRKRDDPQEIDGALDFIARELFPNHHSTGVLYRGVSKDRLEQISKTGCDVSPTTAPIFATDRVSKALEYGELVMVFDPEKLDKTYRTAPKNAPDKILSQLRAEYPTELEVDGELWFSRMPPNNTRTGTIYEWHYTFYIPGDAHEALVMLFCIGDSPDALPHK